MGAGFRAKRAWIRGVETPRKGVETGFRVRNRGGRVGHDDPPEHDTSPGANGPEPACIAESGAYAPPARESRALPADRTI